MSNEKICHINQKDEEEGSVKISIKNHSLIPVVFLIILIALIIGILGYHIYGGLEWIDALLDASMILGGMGPVATMESPGGKVFSSAYALFSGLVFIVVIAVILNIVIDTRVGIDQE